MTAPATAPTARHLPRSVAWRLVALGLLVAAIAFAWNLGLLDRLLDQFDADTLQQQVSRAGAWGPVLIIALMTLAVVASPLPSAPIAVAAGAAYGHYAGAAYVAAGSVLGAMTAFLIARIFGRQAIQRLLGHKLDHTLLGSQTALTLIVFASRLAPFISFDAISYAAGLSPLHLWRFLVATLAGIAPASFVLAHLGSEAAKGNVGSALWVAGGLGALTGASLLLIALRQRPSDRAGDS